MNLIPAEFEWITKWCCTASMFCVFAGIFCITTSVNIIIHPIFAWYDFWIGFYYDRIKKRLYLFPIPMLGIYLEKERSKK